MSNLGERKPHQIDIHYYFDITHAKHSFHISYSMSQTVHCHVYTIVLVPGTKVKLQYKTGLKKKKKKVRGSRDVCSQLPSKLMKYNCCFFQTVLWPWKWAKDAKSPNTSTRLWCKTEQQVCIMQSFTFKQHPKNTHTIIIAFAKAINMSLNFPKLTPHYFSRKACIR